MSFWKKLFDTSKSVEENKPAQKNIKIKTIKIGDQIWMVENLSVNHYRNGDSIPEVQDPKEWKKIKTGAWCYYNNDPENGIKFGKLYNWYAVNDPRRLAPKNWHVPTKDEFEKLISGINGNGNTLKAVGQGSGVGTGTNTYGYSALFAGCRVWPGIFWGLGDFTPFWSSTEFNKDEAYDMTLYVLDSGTYISHDMHKDDGLSVRCVKD